MLTFAVAVALALVGSFLCSIMESVLLSIGNADVEALAQRGKRSGHLLKRFKQGIDVPIAAILIVNTVAHTVGAAVAGASYENVFAAETLWVFTVVFTISVLLLTEIIPKTLGVTYSRELAGPVAWGIQFLSISLRPLVALSEIVSRSLRPDKKRLTTSAEEIRLLAGLARSEGALRCANRKHDRRSNAPDPTLRPRRHGAEARHPIHLRRTDVGGKPRNHSRIGTQPSALLAHG